MTAFRRISEEVRYDGRIVTVAQGTFEAPDGSRFERELVRHPGASSVVAVDDEGRAVLVRQYRAALDAELLEIPAGKLDVDGEPPLECAQRELVEEAGFTAERWEPLAQFHNSPGFSDELVHIFLARGLTEVPHDRQGVEELAMTVERMPLSRAVDLVASGEVTDAKTCIGLLMAYERLGRP